MYKRMILPLLLCASAIASSTTALVTGEKSMGTRMVFIGAPYNQTPPAAAQLLSMYGRLLPLGFRSLAMGSNVLKGYNL